MQHTYTFNEILELIDQSTRPEILAICALLSEEKNQYTRYQLRVIAAAINIHLDHLKLAA